jgi:hypothetical protein
MRLPFIQHSISESMHLHLYKHSIPESNRLYCYSTFHSIKHSSLLLFNISLQKACVFIGIQHFTPKAFVFIVSQHSIPESMRLYCYSTFHSRKHASLLLSNISFQKACVFIVIQHFTPESMRLYC